MAVKLHTCKCGKPSSINTKIFDFSQSVKCYHCGTTINREDVLSEAELSAPDVVAKDLKPVFEVATKAHQVEFLLSNVLKHSDLFEDEEVNQLQSILQKATILHEENKIDLVGK